MVRGKFPAAKQVPEARVRVKRGRKQIGFQRPPEIFPTLSHPFLGSPIPEGICFLNPSLSFTTMRVWRVHSQRNGVCMQQFMAGVTSSKTASMDSTNSAPLEPRTSSGDIG